MPASNRIHSLLTPENCTVIFIDHQPQMTFGVASIDRQLLFNNVIGLAKAAKVFKVPVILTTVETKGFSGYMWPRPARALPRPEADRADQHELVGGQEVRRRGREGRPEEARDGRPCGPRCAWRSRPSRRWRPATRCTRSRTPAAGRARSAHRNAMQRIVQAGAVPVTWQQVLLEFQRDWARKETYDAVMKVVLEHSGAYGQGVEYAYTMVHGQPPAPKRLLKPSH